jgi:hypothetical protein
MRSFVWNGIAVFRLSLHFPYEAFCTFEEMIYAKADDRIESKVAAGEVTFAEGNGMH